MGKSNNQSRLPPRKHGTVTKEEQQSPGGGSVQWKELVGGFGHSLHVSCIEKNRQTSSRVGHVVQQKLVLQEEYVC